LVNFPYQYVLARQASIGHLTPPLYAADFLYDPVFGLLNVALPAHQFSLVFMLVQGLPDQSPILEKFVAYLMILFDKEYGYEENWAPPNFPGHHYVRVRL
jgi:hypothetical protein